MCAAETDASEHAGALQHRVQQHIAPGGDVFGLGVLDLVVADAVLAGDEDHAAGGQTQAGPWPQLWHMLLKIAQEARRI